MELSDGGEERKIAIVIAIALIKMMMRGAAVRLNPAKESFIVSPDRGLDPHNELFCYSTIACRNGQLCGAELLSCVRHRFRARSRAPQVPIGALKGINGYLKLAPAIERG